MRSTAHKTLSTHSTLRTKARNVAPLNVSRASNRTRAAAIVTLLVTTGIVIVSVASFKKQMIPPVLACGDQRRLNADATGKFEPDDQVAWFLGERMSPLAQELSTPKTVVLGESTDEKWIDVDLSTQTLKAMEGDRPVYEFLISSGKWAPTPTGEFRIWIKLRYTKMSGGLKENNTYYYLPNVPYVMYFYKGFGIHGAYWHNNFGHPMSHGCINMAIADAEKIFYWADPPVPDGSGEVKPTESSPGTRVVIHGAPPS